MRRQKDSPPVPDESIAGPTPAAARLADPAPRRPVAAILIAALLVMTILGLPAWYLTRRDPLVIQGEIQCPTFDLAARVDGRVADIPVSRAGNVTRGAPVIRIDNPELLAKYRQSEAELAVAQAALARAKAGVRAETLAVRKAQLDRAAADQTLAQQAYDRKRQLAAARDAPPADLDSAAAALAAADRALAQARSAYDDAVAGDTAEDLAVVQARVEAARAGTEALRALVDQLTVQAPADSQVVRIAVETGEVVVPGVPLITLVDPGDLWVRFDLREDLLADVRPGTRLTVRVPALRDRKVELEVRAIAAKGDYAGWRTPRPAGDFDLRSFEMRAYPTRPVDGLRPGMSVYAEWPDRPQ
jgi:HlyD family secretion protein